MIESISSEGSQRLTVLDALDRLDDLGEPDDIAVYLAGRGYVGKSVTDGCPVALYVRAETGLPVEVDPYFGCGVVWLDEYGVDYPLSNPVCSFARRFDTGRYPGLLDDEAADA